MYGIACMITSSAAVIKHWLVGWQISAIRILKHPDRNRFLPVSVEFFLPQNDNFLNYLARHVFNSQSICGFVFCLFSLIMSTAIILP